MPTISLRVLATTIKTADVLVTEQATVPKWIVPDGICDHCRFPFERDVQFVTAILTAGAQSVGSPVKFLHPACAQQAIKL